MRLPLLQRIFPIIATTGSQWKKHCTLKRSQLGVFSWKKNALVAALTIFVNGHLYE